MRLHFILIMVALAFFGLNIFNPGLLQKLHGEDRVCKMVKGKINCVNRLSEYKINAPVAAFSFN